jgi:hypothetical protein
MDPVFLLLAEGDPTFNLSLTVLIGIITAVAGIGGTFAVLKLKSQMSEDKTRENKTAINVSNMELKAKDDKIEEAIKRLSDQMGENKDVLKSKMIDLNRDNSEKQKRFESKVFGRFDKVDEKITDHEARLSKAETDREHIKKEQDRHSRKLTKTPSSD